MKLLKNIGVFLLFFLLAGAILSFLFPTQQKVERSVTIQAPAAVVYPQLARLENFNRWSAWSQYDSAIRNTITGRDGTVGAINTWEGDADLSGRGQIKIVSLEENRQVVQQISFLSPRQMQADSRFDLSEQGGQTTVTWQFIIATPRPWNIFNLFYSMDKQMGKDFEEGLDNLKTIVEKKQGITAKAYTVTPVNFPATTYAAVREKLPALELPGFYRAHFEFLQQTLDKASLPASAPPAGLIYGYNEKDKFSDVAAALAVPAESRLQEPSVKIVAIPASKALSVDHYGAVDRIGDAYKSLEAYLAQHQLKLKDPIIEQYLAGPATEKDTSRWHTKIFFLVE